MFSVEYLILGFIFIILAISVHEAAHAYAADRLGDPTARALGRLTLNPLAHIDLYGTILLPLFLLVVSGGAFSYGWGKPTPFDPYNLQKPRRDAALISLAGPLSNILVSILVAIIIRFIPTFFALRLSLLIPINIALAVFNLVPVGPLDGQKILFGLLPRDLAYEYGSIMNKYGQLILLFLILPIISNPSPISYIIHPAISFLTNLLLP